MRVRKNVMNVEWEANRQHDIQRMAKEGRLPYVMVHCSLLISRCINPFVCTLDTGMDCSGKQDHENFRNSEAYKQIL